MDRISQSLLNEFVSENTLQSLNESTAFEHFCGHVAVSSHFSESFTTDDITVGAGADCGIDCLAIIVNGCIVTDKDEIADLEETNGYIDATFIFVQAKRSSGFEAAQIGNFGFGVQDYFSENPSMVQNHSIASRYAIMNEIYLRSSKFNRGNPSCYLYYMTTGQWTEDANLVSRRDAVICDLQELNLFRSVVFECVGANRVHELYRESKNAISTQIVFTDKTLLPELPGVQQAYLGILTAPEFLKLLQNSNEEVISSLFYDNVRHWQNWNQVNAEMRETLRSKEKQNYFPLLNNGVTIVAKAVSATRNTFLIEDYQIVNGCQTSYVLHEMRDELTPSVCIPIRLIATDDVDIRNSIIRATNRQTQVSEDQFFAMSEFPKQLEALFPTFEGNKKLYYERRSRQYSSTDGIEKVRVVDMRTLVRAFASVFLQLPHRTTRNYKALLNSVGGDIFNTNHKLMPYYTAAYMNYRLEYLFRNQTLSAELKPARYHLMLGFRLGHSTENLPAMSSNAMERRCAELLEILWDDDRSIEAYKNAENVVRSVADGNLHRDNIRTEPFTERFIGMYEL